MDLQALQNLIGNLGFPIAVTCYFMFTVNKTIKDVNDSVNKLITVIQTLVVKEGGQ